MPVSQEHKVLRSPVSGGRDKDQHKSSVISRPMCTFGHVVFFVVQMVTIYILFRLCFFFNNMYLGDHSILIIFYLWNLIVSSFAIINKTALNYLEYSSFHIFKSTVFLEDKVLEVEFRVKWHMHLCLR